MSEYANAETRVKLAGSICNLPSTQTGPLFAVATRKGTDWAGCGAKDEEVRGEDGGIRRE